MIKPRSQCSVLCCGNLGVSCTVTWLSPSIVQAHGSQHVKIYLSQVNVLIVCRFDHDWTCSAQVDTPNSASHSHARVAPLVGFAKLHQNVGDLGWIQDQHVVSCAAELDVVLSERYFKRHPAADRLHHPPTLNLSVLPDAQSLSQNSYSLLNGAIPRLNFRFCFATCRFRSRHSKFSTLLHGRSHRCACGL